MIIRYKFTFFRNCVKIGISNGFYSCINGPPGMQRRIFQNKRDGIGNAAGFPKRGCV